MSFISLLTDFGIKDGYPGVMKGVILGITPNAHIADITHMIQPQNIMDGTLALARAVPYFPQGSIHVAVVDPGVGTQRRPIAARLELPQFGCGDLVEHYFVGPDNGLCTSLVETARRAGGATVFIHLNRPAYWLSEISHVFHGRDIFAPVAAHLSIGVPLESLGDPIDDPVLLQLPVPQHTPTGLKGQVTVVDHFGNLATNLTRDLFPSDRQVRVQIAGYHIPALVETFGSAEPGQLVSMFGEIGDLTIAVVNGSAADSLGVTSGETVEVFFD